MGDICAAKHNVVFMVDTKIENLKTYENKIWMKWKAKGIKHIKNTLAHVVEPLKINSKNRFNTSYFTHWNIDRISIAMLSCSINLYSNIHWYTKHAQDDVEDWGGIYYVSTVLTPNMHLLFYLLR